MKKRNWIFLSAVSLVVVFVVTISKYNKLNLKKRSLYLNPESSANPLPSSSLSKPTDRIDHNKSPIHKLNHELRSLPVSDSEVSARVKEGLDRAFVHGHHFNPVKVETLQDAERHLYQNSIHVASMKLSYGIELDDWFAFSGLVNFYPEEIREEKHQAVFKFGWAVRKEDGKIVKWEEAPNQ